MPWEYRPVEFAPQLLHRDARELTKIAADAAADVLRANINFGVRSGFQWTKLPHRSSAPDEFPQLQTGDLFNSVTSLWQEPVGGNLASVVGFWGDPDKIASIEFGDEHEGGRAPLTRTMEDSKTHALMLATIAEQRAGGPSTEGAFGVEGIFGPREPFRSPFTPGTSGFRPSKRIYASQLWSNTTLNTAARRYYSGPGNVTSWREYLKRFRQ